MILKAPSTKHQARTASRFGFLISNFVLPAKRGYTLVELIVAMGLFAIVITLATGAYLVMIGVTRQTQGLATGANNLAFVLDGMTTSIRTGTDYDCGAGGDCPSGGSSLSFTDQDGRAVTYALAGAAITRNGVPLTAPAVTIRTLTFYVNGTEPFSQSRSDVRQPTVIITVAGRVEVAPGKTRDFSVESAAVMRGTDL